MNASRTFYSTQEEKLSHFLNGGYGIKRHFFKMVVDLDRDIPDPIFPLNIKIRTFDRKKDLKNAVLCDRACFTEHWGYVDRSVEEDIKEWEYMLDTDPHARPEPEKSLITSR